MPGRDGPFSEFRRDRAEEPLEDLPEFRVGLRTSTRGGEGVLELGWGVELRFGQRPVWRLEVRWVSLSRGHRSRTVAWPVSLGSLVNVLGEATGDGWVMEDKTEHGEVDGGGAGIWDWDGCTADLGVEEAATGFGLMARRQSVQEFIGVVRFLLAGTTYGSETAVLR